MPTIIGRLFWNKYILDIIVFGKVGVPIFSYIANNKASYKQYWQFLKNAL